MTAVILALTLAVHVPAVEQPYAPLQAPRPAWRVLYDLKWPKRRRSR